MLLTSPTCVLTRWVNKLRFCIQRNDTQEDIQITKVELSCRRNATFDINVKDVKASQEDEWSGIYI